MNRPDLTPEQSAAIRADFEAMNEARDAMPTLLMDLAFYAAWTVAAVIASLLLWLAVNAAADSATASAAQTELCRPDCAVGPYHHEMEQ